MFYAAWLVETLHWGECHCGYRRYFNQGLSHHCELVVTGREAPLAKVYTCGEIGLCTPCRWAHPIYGVGPSEWWVEAGGGALGAPAATHHSDGILSHLGGGWRRERRRLIKECICHQFLRVLFKI